MEHSLTDAEETVNAVLEEVLDDAQHWRSPGLHEDQDLTLSAEHSEQRMQTQLQDSRKVTTDQAVTTPADGSGTNDPDTATAMATLCQIAPVQSAMNPLFQPAQLVRPQSAQLQHTLSSMKRQLSALENSMQQPPGIEADGDPLASSTADVPLDASSAATAGASNAAMARADAAVTSNTAGTSSLAAPVQSSRCGNPLGHDRDAAQLEAGPVDIPGLSKGTRDEIRWSRRSKDAVWQRPVTAGQGHMPWMQEGIQGSVERPSSPVRERMKHAVERESCLRLEAEMAALDVGELLHQKAAAEGAAQAEAAKNAELQQQMAQVKEELHAARRDASRQHARELQLDLTQAHMANAALRLQLDEAQMEVTAEHERSKAAESALEAQRPGGGASLAALQGQTVNVNGASKSSQRQDCSGNGEEDEHRQRTDQAMGSHSPPASHDSSSAGTATQLTQQQQQQQDDSPLPENTSRLSQPSAPASDSHMESQLTRSSSSLQKTLADLAESLTMDVTKLKGLLDCSEADGTMSKVANWGFPKHEAGDSPGPSRPVTATPCDNMQRPNRQWSAGPTRHEAYRQQAGDAGQQRQSRPMTATIHGRFAHDAVGMSLVDAAGRRSGVVPNRRSGQGKQADMWIDPVPPTRMPEEILQQAREDYMKEKKRVRDKRLQELAAKAGDMTNAASQ
ncbi:MAG: hypothetical protein FRX49_10049 [Trebouxia sp. A1-2]|nr:MAG: hypothetical protein FRX49_10049 [Trebouxia sp. A1-2]